MNLASLLIFVGFQSLLSSLEDLGIDTPDAPKVKNVVMMAEAVIETVT